MGSVAAMATAQTSSGSASAAVSAAAAAADPKQVLNLEGQAALAARLAQGLPEAVRVAQAARTAFPLPLWLLKRATTVDIRPLVGTTHLVSGERGTELS